MQANRTLMFVVTGGKINAGLTKGGQNNLMPKNQQQGYTVSISDPFFSYYAFYTFKPRNRDPCQIRVSICL
jgi:hypothetical protein